MKQSSNKGFASNPIIHKFASSKGGKVRTKKGLGSMPIEKRRAIQSLGGKQSANNRRNGVVKSKKDTSGDIPNLADILGGLDEERL